MVMVEAIDPQARCVAGPSIAAVGHPRSLAVDVIEAIGNIHWIANSNERDRSWPSVRRPWSP